MRAIITKNSIEIVIGQISNKISITRSEFISGAAEILGMMDDQGHPESECWWHFASDLSGLTITGAHPKGSIEHVEAIERRIRCYALLAAASSAAKHKKSSIERGKDIVADAIFPLEEKKEAPTEMQIPGPARSPLSATSPFPQSYAPTRFGIISPKPDPDYNIIRSVLMVSLRQSFAEIYGANFTARLMPHDEDRFGINLVNMEDHHDMGGISMDASANIDSVFKCFDSKGLVSHLGNNEVDNIGLLVGRGEFLRDKFLDLAKTLGIMKDGLGPDQLLAITFKQLLAPQADPN